MLYVERPKASGELVEACPLAVAKWALEDLTLTNDDATAKQCAIVYVFHGVALLGLFMPWLDCLGLSS